MTSSPLPPLPPPPPTPPGRAPAGYFEAAGSWAADRDAGLRASRRWAWIVAGVAVGIAALEAAALCLMAPLKTVEPYTLLVDRQTGYVQALETGRAGTIAADEALTQAFLAQYVIAREGFDLATVSADYRKVALWSAGPARADYLALMAAANPRSPLSRYPRDAIVAVEVRSVSMLRANTAMVRFQSRRQDVRDGPVPDEFRVAIVEFRYDGAPMSIADRMINPLGFQVVGYRVDAETPPSPATPALDPPPAALGDPIDAVPAPGAGQ